MKSLNSNKISESRKWTLLALFIWMYKMYLFIWYFKRDATTYVLFESNNLLTGQPAPIFPPYSLFIYQQNNLLIFCSQSSTDLPCTQTKFKFHTKPTWTIHHGPWQCPSHSCSLNKQSTFLCQRFCTYRSLCLDLFFPQIHFKICSLTSFKFLFKYHLQREDFPDHSY